jgi:hypothetical protein
MIRKAPTLIVGLVASALIAAACSSGGSDDSTTTTTSETTTTTTLAETTTTAQATTTTSTVPGLEVSGAINGLPADEALIERRVVAVKIDNHIKARPQSGLEIADAVFEIPVEGGITRFIALFHQSDSDYVGPNRSGRVTDSKIMAALAGGPIQISGAQGWVQSVFASDGVNVSYDTGATTFRRQHRSAPHNLFTSTLLIRDYADERGWPDESPGNLFVFGEPTPGEGSATTIVVPFSGTPPSNWEWDGEQYLHFQGAQPHIWVTEDDEETGQVAFDTLVVLKVRKYTASPSSGSGTPIPSVETVGTGDALAFYGGQVVAGSWERGSIEDLFSLIAEDGTELVLPPGRVWIHLQPDTETVTWE